MRESIRSLQQRNSINHDSIVDLFIAYGELESALVDSLYPEVDSIDNRIRTLRDLSLLHGRLLHYSWTNRLQDQKGLLEEISERIDDSFGNGFSSDLKTRISEGYAFYGLAPETYLESAIAFFKSCRPRNAVCIGIRSIGTSLSGAVAGVLQELGCQVTSFTVRPHGHPFHRTISVTREISRVIENANQQYFLIIDEGPGLSGSSFGCVAKLLSRRGIPDDHIILFPSWLPSAEALCSATGRTHWRRHRKFYTRFEDAYIKSGFLLDHHEYIDISAGQWRALLFQEECDYPAVQPQHEMRKFLLPLPNHNPLLYKFAGFGAYGRHKFRRAEQLSETGFSPKVLGLRHGFLIYDFIPAVPLDRGQADKAFLQSAAQYMSFVVDRFSSPLSPSRTDLLELLHTNIGESLGEQSLSCMNRLESIVKRLDPITSTSLDGRMLPHEWIFHNGSFLKTDSVDHGNDHFFPGPQDITWDVAALAVEFRLDPEQLSFLLHCLQTSANLKIPQDIFLFYRILYLAFRVGYTFIAAQSFQYSMEATRFQRCLDFYSRQLRHDIEFLKSLSFCG